MLYRGHCIYQQIARCLYLRMRALRTVVASLLCVRRRAIIRRFRTYTIWCFSRDLPVFFCWRWIEIRVFRVSGLDGSSLDRFLGRVRHLTTFWVSGSISSAAAACGFWAETAWPRTSGYGGREPPLSPYDA